MSDATPPRRVRQKDWVLTQDALDRLLAWLDSDPQSAGERYCQLREKLVRFFQWRGSPSPEEYADRTLDRVARRLEEGRDSLGEPQSFAYGVALNVWREQQREPRHDSLDSVAASGAPFLDPEEQFERENERLHQDRLAQALEGCIGELPVETRALVVSYHCSESNKRRRKELAAELGIGLEPLRTRAYRIRLALERCVRSRIGQAT